jgi:hypothetical protein
MDRHYCEERKNAGILVVPTGGGKTAIAARSLLQRYIRLCVTKLIDGKPVIPEQLGRGSRASPVLSIISSHGAPNTLITLIRASFRPHH